MKNYLDPDWAEPVEELANQICEFIPEGFELSINFEDGCAGVTLSTQTGWLELPDSADKSLAEQINDALNVANSDLRIEGEL